MNGPLEDVVKRWTAKRKSALVITPSGWQAGIEPSVDSVDDSYDNALAETSGSLLKAEAILRRSLWHNFEAVKHATFAWVDSFNNCYLLEPIGNIPPADAEANFYTALALML